MDALLNYSVDATPHCVIAYSIESGKYAVNVEGDSAIATYTDTSVTPARTSFSAGINNNNTVTVSVGDTSDNTKIYYSTISNNSGVITTADIGITTTISLVTP
jgi:hypothetical protein